MLSLYVFAIFVMMCESSEKFWEIWSPEVVLAKVVSGFVHVLCLKPLNL